MGSIILAENVAGKRRKSAAGVSEYPSFRCNKNQENQGNYTRGNAVLQKINGMRSSFYAMVLLFFFIFF